MGTEVLGYDRTVRGWPMDWGKASGAQGQDRVTTGGSVRISIHAYIPVLLPSRAR